MKRLALLTLVLLAMLWFANGAFGGDVVWYLKDSQGTIQANRQLFLFYLTAPTNSFSTNLITRDRIVKTTDSTGYTILTNYTPGIWRSEHQGTFGVTTNWYLFPVTNGTIYAADPQWQTAPTSLIPFQVYTTAASDARYITTNSAVILNAITNQGNATLNTVVATNVTLADAAGTVMQIIFNTVGIIGPNFDQIQMALLNGTTPRISLLDHSGNLQSLYATGSIGNFYGSGSGLTNVQPANGRWYETNFISAGALMGANDDTTLMQGLLNAGWRVFLPPTTNYTFARLTFTNNSGLRGQGTLLKFKTGVTNAPMLDGMSNSNVVWKDLILDGQYYPGSASGVSNRIAMAPYAYGQGGVIENVTALGFDYGIRPTGDKTTTTSHQSSTVNIHDITCYSNFCGIYFSSPDASHVVEYLTVSRVNSFQNFWGALIDAGNINLVGCDFNNNNFGFGMPGTGVNNSHGSITGSKINHNTAGFGITNVISGEIIIGNQFNANTDVGFIHASRGVNLSFNHIASGNLWVVQGSANTRNYVWFNNADGFGGGSGATFTVLDFDGTASHGMNNSILDSTGDGFIFYGTNMPGIAVQQELTHTNSFSLINSNATSDMWIAINDGSGTRVDQPIALRKARTATKTSNATVLTTDTGAIFNNNGAGGAVTNTLPAATVGLNYGLDVDAAQNLAFKAVGSDTIRNAGTVSAAAGLVFSSTIGGTVHLTCHVAGKWVVDSMTGSWTVQ